MKRGDTRTPIKEPSRPETSSRKLPNRLLRYCINVWVVLHFTAIIAAAATIGPAAGYVLATWQLFHPYVQFLFLNHGFNFYAPEPSSSMLMEFEAVRPDGSSVTGRIPDPTLWPRLLYQRHLLLTEHISIAPVDDRTMVPVLRPPSLPEIWCLQGAPHTREPLPDAHGEVSQWRSPG